MTMPDFYDEPMVQSNEINDNSFIKNVGLNRYVLHGYVSSINKEPVYYGRLFKLIRSVVHGEPYQLLKTGRNKFGATATYTYLRVVPVDGYGQTKEVMVYNDRINLCSGDEVEISSSKKINGTFIAKSITVVSTGERINTRSFSIPAWLVRILFALLMLTIVWVVKSIYSFVTEGGLFAVISELMPTLIIILGIFWLLRTVFGRRRRGRRRY